MLPPPIVVIGEYDLMIKLSLKHAMILFSNLTIATISLLKSIYFIDSFKKHSISFF